MSVQVVEDTWLSSLMGRSAYRVDVGPGSTPVEVAKAVAAHSGAAGAFYSLKTDAANVPVVEAVRPAGFFVADVNVTLARLPERLEQSPRTAVAVGPCTPELAEAVLDIAGSCFKYSRFHVDPRVGISVADRIKREWIRSYVEGRRGDSLMVATRDGVAQGFLAALSRREGEARIRVIDLIGVATPAQGAGVGAALLRAFINDAVTRCERLEVGTQASNIPSLNLYAKCGFKPARSQFVLHAHRGVD